MEEDVEKNQPQPTQQLQLLPEEADLEEDDSDKEKYINYKKRYLCPLKATTNCSGKEKGYKHKATLNCHICKHHPEDYQSLVDIKSISYTNTRTQAINKSMMMLKNTIITGTLPDGNNSTAALDQQLLLEYSSVTENQITDGVDTEENLSVESIAQLETVQYVL